MDTLSRREFLGSWAAVSAIAGLSGCASGFFGPSAGSRNVFGACRDLEDASLMRDLGYDFIENGVSALLVPTKSDAEFAPFLAAMKSCPLPIRACNGLFPPNAWKLTGPERQWEPALRFADVAFRRADEAGIRYLVFGSGGARRAPAGYPPDKARDEFVEFSRRLADLLEARGRRVIVVLEPLSPAECGFFNTVPQGVAMVDAINSPHVRLLADMFHMFSSEEPGADIVAAGPRILHCHVAERPRTAPGVAGTDLSEYFDAFKKIGYTGGFSLECSWPKEAELPVQATLANALAVMKHYTA